MPTTPTLRSRRPRRRVLAATAALGLALGLTACTIGEGDDDEAATAGSAAQSTAPAASTPAQEQAAAGADTSDTPDTPDTPVDQLVLGDQDAPGLGLVPVSPEQLTGGIDALDQLTAGMRVEPEHCADFSQDAFLSQSEPGVMAIQSGQTSETQIAVAVTTLTSGLPDLERMLGDCATMTVSIPMQGAQVTSESRNTLLPVDAPAGVEEFAAVSQDSTMDMAGQTVRTGTVMLTGVIRGVGISVTATSGTGPVSAGVKDTALDTFVRQVVKIRSA